MKNVSKKKISGRRRTLILDLRVITLNKIVSTWMVMLYSTWGVISTYNSIIIPCSAQVMCRIFFFLFIYYLFGQWQQKYKARLIFFPYYTVRLERWRLQEPYHQVPNQNTKFGKNLTVANQIWLSIKSRKYNQPLWIC